MPEPDAGRNDPYLNTDSIRRLLDALRLRLHYAGQAVEEGELEKAEYVVAGRRLGGLRTAPAPCARPREG
jgi:hypothetical protein